jgi:hypothetical protein
LLDFLGQQIDKMQPICIVKKDRFAAITMGSGVIDGAGEFEPVWAGHQKHLVQQNYNVKN